MDRPIAVASIVILLVAVLPAAAHGNTISAGDQLSADGTVVVEFVSLITDGFVVLHADDGGDPGPIVGHRSTGDEFLLTAFEVQVSEGFWANRTGNTSLWAVLHRDTGDGSFAAGDDPALKGADGTIVGVRFGVRKNPAGPVNVVAEGDHPHRTNESSVTVPRVTLATAGHLVVRANESGAPGRIVGASSLEAGTHRNVTVDVEDGFYEHRPKLFSLWAVAYRDDGDGTLDEADAPFKVADRPVASRFTVERTGKIDEHTHEHETTSQTGSPTPAPAQTPTQSPTPTATAPPTPTASATPSPQATRQPTTASEPRAVETTAIGDGSTGAETPGFGPAAALLAMGLLLLRRRL